MEMILEIMNLKKQKRRGWIISGRSMNPGDVESVSDHSWAASMIALLYLPEQLDNSYVVKDYSKEKIIKMLIVHDLAESFLGDIVYGMKTIEYKKNEKERFHFYSLLNETKYMNKLYKVNDLWEEFEELQTFNSKVAKDIDQIESFIQLNMYKEILINKNGVIKWEQLKEEWKKNILLRTHLGEGLFSQFEELFDTPKNIL